MGQPLRVLFDLPGAGGRPREPLAVPLRLLREWRRNLSHTLPSQAECLYCIQTKDVHSNSTE